MALVTTDMETMVAHSGYFRQAGSSTDSIIAAAGLCGMTTLNNGIPGFLTCTYDTQIAIPIQYPGSKMAFVVIYDSPSTAPGYPAFDIQCAPSSDGLGWGGRNVTPSTKNDAWVHFVSTAAFVATSSEAECYIMGPIDTAKFAQNWFAAGSSAASDYQPFLRVCPGMSTVSMAQTYGPNSTVMSHANISTAAGGSTDYKCFVMAIEIP